MGPLDQARFRSLASLLIGPINPGRQIFSKTTRGSRVGLRRVRPELLGFPGSSQPSARSGADPSDVASGDSSGRPLSAAAGYWHPGLASASGPSVPRTGGPLPAVHTQFSAPTTSKVVRPVGPIHQGAQP